MALEHLAQHPGLTVIQSAFDRTAAEIFVVGGAVRDAIIGRPVTDLDMVIRGLAAKKIESRLKTIGAVSFVGKVFAVFKVTIDGHVIDVALPRTDASFGTGRYRDVEVKADPLLPIERDLERRDFTINAMAWRLSDRVLIDPFNGQSDIATQTIRCVGNPDIRFQEDASRMLRALRFSAELHYDLDLATRESISRHLRLLADAGITPREVIAKELVRGMTAAPARMFKLLDQTGLMTAIIPELARLKGCAQSPDWHSEGDVWTHIERAMELLEDQSFRDVFGYPPSAQTIVTVLLHDIGKMETQQIRPDSSIGFPDHAHVGADIASKICSRLKLSAAGINCDVLTWCIRHHLDAHQITEMRPATFVKTFIESPGSQTLLETVWADERASLRPDDRSRGRRFHPTSSMVTAVQKQIEHWRKLSPTRELPAALLTGREIIELLDVPAGPEIGQLLEALRNEQLNGSINSHEQAIAFITSRHAS